MIDLKTGVTPSASGSAYLEMEPGSGIERGGLKLTCTVHGPRCLPRSAPFSPHMILSTHVKYAPFATRRRRGHLREPSERDLSTHLEAALRGVVFADRWPKSGVDVVVTVIEGDMACHTMKEQEMEEWNIMSVLSGCITVAAAAVADAGIDCVDTASGGVAALMGSMTSSEESVVVFDPVPLRNHQILAACCVAYLPNRDEIANIWLKGSLAPETCSYRTLIAQAVQASRAAGQVVSESLDETVTMS